MLYTRIWKTLANIMLIKINQTQTFQAVHWLRLLTFSAGDVDSISDQGTKIPYGVWSIN